MSSRWGIYLKERFPVIPNLLVAMGIMFSAAFIAKHSFGANPSLIVKVIAVFGGMVFLAQIRFMDELKDLEKDKLAHPERPLPRGLFSPQEFSNFILGFNVLMLVLSGVAFFFINPTSGIFFGVGTIYLYLMYKEFFVGEWLSNRPMLYAITHQFITYPMAAFVMTAFSKDSWKSPEMGWLTALLIGSFFGFEVGRKLDPNAHAVLKTYLWMYGKFRTGALIVFMLGIASFAAVQLNVGVILIPLYGLILLSLSLVWFAPSKFKWVEGFISLYLVLSLWAIPIRSLF